MTAASRYDISIILNIHREAEYLRSTLRSLDEAAAKASAEGIATELIAVFDRSDRVTVSTFDQVSITNFKETTKLEVNFGSLGQSRNAGIQIATGKYISTADADDLITSNFLVSHYAEATGSKSDRTIMIPQYLVGFGERSHVVKYYDSSLLTIADFVYQHPYISRIFCRKETFIENPYQRISIESGYAYEDWDLNIRLYSAGYKFAAVKNCILFYRQRQGSLLEISDRLSARITPHNSAFERSTYLRQLELAKGQISDWDQFARSRQALHKIDVASEITGNKILFEHVLRLNKIDPEIKPYDICRFENYTAVPYEAEHWGFYLASAFNLVGRTVFSDIVLLPWLNPGGGEKFIIKVLSEIERQVPNSNVLVICGEASQQHIWRHRLPGNCTFLDVVNAFPDLSEHDRDMLTVRMLLALSGPDIRLHIKSSVFSHRMIDRFGVALLGQFKSIYYRFSDAFHAEGKSQFRDPSTIKFLRRHGRLIARVIVDNATILESDRQIMGFITERYSVLRCKTPLTDRKRPTSKPLYRLLWASRLCSEKRSEILPALMSALAGSFPQIHLDVYGDGAADLEALNHNNSITYRGGFDSFDDLPVNQYDALLYTSKFDGMPNIVLEAMASGLVVVAPDVGGIAEILNHQITGFLAENQIDDELMIANYLRAFIEFYQNWNSYELIQKNASDSIRIKYGETQYAEVIENFVIN